VDGQEQPFVGREAQLGALISTVAAAEIGEGAVAFVGGEAGIGKTGLVAEVATRVACPVLWSRCWDGEGAPAFWPWQQLLRTVLAEDGVAGLRRPGRYDHEELGRLLGEAQAVGDADGGRFRHFDAVVDVFAAAAARRSFALVVDDLHWADEPSVRLLQFIGRDPRARRLAIIGTYRDSGLEASSPLIRCFADLADRGVHVSLRGLGERDVAVLVGALTGERAVTANTVSILHRQTGGNPLFLRELLRLLDVEGALNALGDGSRSPVPSGVRAVVAQRLTHLSPRTCEVLRAASVVGADFEVGTVTSLMGRAREDVLAALEQAVSAGLLHRTRDGGGFGFVHAVVRAVLYDGMAPTVRGPIHRRAASLLEAQGGLRHLPQLAHHLLQGAVDADDRRRAVEYAVRAGNHNLQLLAYEEAAEWFARALGALGAEHADDPREVGLHLALGEASLAAGDLTRARNAYQRAAALAQRDQNPEQLTQAALGLGTGFGGFEVQLLDPVQVQLLEQALEALAPEPSVLRTWVLARLSVALSFMDSQARRRELSEAAVAMGRQVDDPRALGYALAGHCDVIAGPDGSETRRADAEEVIRLGRQADDPRLELLGRRLRVVALLEMGEIGEADAEIERFAWVADRLRQPLYRWYVALWKAMRSLMRRELDETTHRHAEAEEIGARAHSGNATVLTFTQWWVQERYEGRFAEAGAAVADLLRKEVAAAAPSPPDRERSPRCRSATMTRRASSFTSGDLRRA
jgi:tetratricopeptide (TPR) repeat protein